MGRTIAKETELYEKLTLEYFAKSIPKEYEVPVGTNAFIEMVFRNFVMPSDQVWKKRWDGEPTGYYNEEYNPNSKRGNFRKPKYVYGSSTEQFALLQKVEGVCEERIGILGRIERLDRLLNWIAQGDVAGCHGKDTIRLLVGQKFLENYVETKAPDAEKHYAKISSAVEKAWDVMCQ